MIASCETSRLREPARFLESPPKVVSADWLHDNISMPRGTETAGMPFSLAHFPHLDGPLAAFDNPATRIIALQFGTRLGKTTTALSLMGQTAATNPRNMMVAGPTKDSIKNVVSSRLYPLLESTRGLEVPSPGPGRSNFHVKLPACNIFVGWSGSDTSLADRGAWFGLANEIDKWSTESSDEADPLSLFLNRFKGFPGHKIILESTPTRKGHSRIEKWMQRSNQHRRYVPCPHCGEYQIIKKGDGQQPGGFRWEKGPSGKSDPDIAQATAWYECEHCRGRIENHHRIPMLRAGRWVPDGCAINPAGVIEGKPRKPDCEIVGFGPLPSWYSLLENWGSFPRRWIQALGDVRELQDVINSYMAETWEDRHKTATWEELGRRANGRFQRGQVPDNVGLLTLGIDVQHDYFIWVLMGWGLEDIGYLIDYGATSDWSDIAGKTERDSEGNVRLQHGLLTRLWPGQTLAPLRVSMAGIDSSARTSEVYDFIKAFNASFRTGRLLRATKGQEKKQGKAVWPSSLEFSRDPGRASSFTAAGHHLWNFWKEFFQEEFQRRIGSTDAHKPGSLTMCEEAANDQDLLEQLLNNAPLETKAEHIVWGKVNDADPDDYRDAAVIARVCREMKTRGSAKAIEMLLAERKNPQANIRPEEKPRFTTPDGRPFFILDR